FYRVSDGADISAFTLPFGSSAVYGLDRIALSLGADVSVYSLLDGSTLASFPGDSVTSSADYRILATTQRNASGLLNFRRASDFSLIRSYRPSLSYDIAVALSADGTLAVTGDGGPGSSDLKLWDVGSGILLRRLNADRFEFPTRTVSFSPQSDLLAAF